MQAEYIFQLNLFTNRETNKEVFRQGQSRLETPKTVHIKVE